MPEKHSRNAAVPCTRFRALLWNYSNVDCHGNNGANFRRVFMLRLHYYSMRNNNNDINDNSMLQDFPIHHWFSWCSWSFLAFFIPSIFQVFLFSFLFFFLSCFFFFDGFQFNFFGSQMPSILLTCPNHASCFVWIALLPYLSRLIKNQICGLQLPREPHRSTRLL